MSSRILDVLHRLFLFYLLQSIRCRSLFADRPTACAIKSPSLPFYHTFRALSDKESTMDPQPAAYTAHPLPTAASITYQLPEAFQTSFRLSILKLVEILSSITSEIGDATVNALLQIRCWAYFDAGLFKSAFKHANDGKYMVHLNEEKVLIENGLQRCTLLKHIALPTGPAVHYKGR